MDKIRISFFLINIFLINNIYPQSRSQRPMLIERSVSGNFGELRPNHFHSGVDYRTFGKIGVPVYSVESGYVSRVKIQITGYGKAVYITHPKTGETSVYAHLDRFNEDIEKIIKKMQYKRKSYTVDMAFMPNKIPIKKGKIIAYSGNTGGSMGPHLHFEIRDTETGKPLNPMKNGFEEKDTRFPVLENIYIIPIKNKYDFSDYFNHRKISFDAKNEVYGDFGIGVSAHDKIDNSASKNGVYSVCLKMDGDTLYYRRLDDFSFNETRYINNLIHYSEMIRVGNFIEKCFIGENQNLSVYNFFSKNGIIKARKDEELKFELALEDESGNSTIKNFTIYSKQNINETKYENGSIYLIETNKEKKIENHFYSINIAKGAFYDNIYLNVKEQDNSIKIGNIEIPVHKKIKIKFLDTLKNVNKTKYFISNKTKKGWGYNNTYYKNGYFIADVGELGEYSLKNDFTKPEIRVAKVSKKSNYLNIYSRDKETGIKFFNAYINDKWILCEYDYKKNLFRYDFRDIKFEEKELTLRVELEDYVGNINIVEQLIKK